MTIVISTHQENNKYETHIKFIDIGTMDVLKKEPNFFQQIMEIIKFCKPQDIQKSNEELYETVTWKIILKSERDMHVCANSLRNMLASYDRGFITKIGNYLTINKHYIINPNDHREIVVNAIDLECKHPSIHTLYNLLEKLSCLSSTENPVSNITTLKPLAGNFFTSKDLKIIDKKLLEFEQQSREIKVSIAHHKPPIVTVRFYHYEEESKSAHGCLLVSFSKRNKPIPYYDPEFLNFRTVIATMATMGFISGHKYFSLNSKTIKVQGAKQICIIPSLTTFNAVPIIDELVKRLKSSNQIIQVINPETTNLKNPKLTWAKDLVTEFEASSSQPESLFNLPEFLPSYNNLFHHHQVHHKPHQSYHKPEHSLLKSSLLATIYYPDHTSATINFGRHHNHLPIAARIIEHVEDTIKNLANSNKFLDLTDDIKIEFHGEPTVVKKIHLPTLNDQIKYIISTTLSDHKAMLSQLHFNIRTEPEEYSIIEKISHQLHL